MKIGINKSAKRVLSIALALVMLVGTLFTANIGVNITAGAETATPIAEGTIDLLEFGSYLTNAGSTSQYWDTNVADNGETGADWDNAIIIDSAEELVYICKASGNTTKGKYYKVADGIAGFNLATSALDVNGTLADNLAKIQGSGKNHAGSTGNSFQGYFDGNGATVYGAWTNHNSNSLSAYVGLFSCTYGDVIIKNINVNKASFTGSAAAGGIVGYHKADDATSKLIIENCSVTDSHLEATAAAKGYGTGVGAILGYGASAPSHPDTGDVDSDGNTTETVYENVPYIIRNCYVNLDENYFTSIAEDGTEASGERACHGGVAGVAGSNALAVSDCIVIGIKPYATSESSAYNDVQHTGLASHFSNVYTTSDVKITGVEINRNTGWTAGQVQDYTGRIFPLSTEQMQGDAAVTNMNLEWFSAWIPGEDGEYPTLNQTGAESDISFWSGSAATEFAGGTGTKEDPFIIQTADQLYRALSLETGTTEGVASGESTSVAGGVQSDKMLKQGSTTEYVPVYTPYYYKVADGVKAFYLNSIYGSESLDGAKAMAATTTKKDWKPRKSFVGHLDGNGVTIYGMYSSTGEGLVYKLDGSSTVKNINFDSCYSSGTGNAALLTTNLGSYTNDTTIINISNISVRNSYIATTRNITLKATDSDPSVYRHDPGAAGIVSSSNTAEALTISNCLYDGYSCERAIGTGSEAKADMMGAIISGGHGMNNTVLNGCVSLGAPAVDEVYISGKEIFYNRYDKNLSFPVNFYNCYSDMPLNDITTTYPNKYDKLLDIERIDEVPSYEMHDMPKLAWSNWALVETDDARTIPMPTVNTADNIVGSYVSVIAAEAKTNKYSGVGPYVGGTNPYGYTLKGSGTEADPYIIETDVQLARAIATGGMNLYDKLYYKLGNDIDISGGTWLTQDSVSTSSASYTYTPFGGTLDGDGHTITGLTAGDSASAGLIPVLEGGTVKNLHLRDVTVVSGDYAAAIVGWMYGGSVTGCSVENAVISSAGGYGDGLYIVYNNDIWSPAEYGTITDSYYIGKDGDGNDITVYITDHNADDGVVMATADELKKLIDADDEYRKVWYIGGKEGSLPRLINHAKAMVNVDVAGDGKADNYGSNDLTALRNKLLKKDDYQNIYGDVSRDGKVNLIDLAVLNREIVGTYGEVITDGFWANVKKGQVDIYYGENDNYDAARKLELYLESAFPGVDVSKHVSASAGTVSGAESNSAQVYLHADDTAESPDGKLEIIVGNIDNYSAYATNTDATAANTYAVTYNEANQVLWLQGENFTAVEQAVLNFIANSDVTNNTAAGVYKCGSTELENYKKPITVQLDTNYDGTVDTATTMYYAWGDEFEEDTVNTNNWQHNTQQSEGTQGKESNYKDQEVAPIKDLGKMLVVEDGKLSMKRGYDSTGTNLGPSTNGYVDLDVTPGEENGYSQWTDDANGANAIDTDGSDQYFSSGKITTERGMLFKQGYLEIEAQLPADGHAFPAWWLMGRPAQSQTNSGYDNSLYSKVYKLNTKWNGSASYTANNLDTYKYQIPSAIYEIDMIEVMQAGSRISGKDGLFGLWGDDWVTKWDTAVGWYAINTTIHKWWNNGVYNGGTSDDTSDDLLYIHDWDNYNVLGGITNSNFSTTSTAGSWIHNPGSTEMDFGTSTNSQTVNATARDDLQKSRRYGFSWYTDAVSGFEATLYVYNDDGSIRETLPIASGMSKLNAFKDKNGNTEANGAIGSNAGVYSDAKVFNQYMYILLDNKFYSSNEKYSGGAKVFTDLLTAAGLTSLEIEYVRLYQQDGERDIVTKETEAFNNANHFGYN